jgi:hypothetical protein
MTRLDVQHLEGKFKCVPDWMSVFTAVQQVRSITYVCEEWRMRKYV